MAYKFDYAAYVKRLRTNPKAQAKLNEMFTVSAMPMPGETRESVAARTKKMVEEQKALAATPKPSKTQNVEDYKKEIERESKLSALQLVRARGVDISQDILLVNNRFMITNDTELTNPFFPRPSQTRGLDLDDLDDHIEDTIFELLPKSEIVEEPTPAQYPLEPPVDGILTTNKIFVANWGMLSDYGGSTDVTKNLSDKKVRKDNHHWPAIYGINPIYKFFTGDNPLFYIYNPTSYIDPETKETVPTEDITWKINGREVRRGRFFQMYEVRPTEGVKQLEVEIRNEVGVKTETITYEIVDSDKEGDREGFSSTYDGMFSYDPAMHDGRGYAVFTKGGLVTNADGEAEIVQDAYQPRWVKFTFKFINYGNGKNTGRKFRKKNPSIKIDGKELNNGKGLYKANKKDVHGKLHGQRIHEETYYFPKPPGPFTIELNTSFRYRKKLKKRTRKWTFKKDYNIALNDPIDKVFDLGVLNVGSSG